jgi:hypothetical protein
MRYLVGPDKPGDRSDDFTWTEPGEPLLANEGGCGSPGCGCERSFIGVNSRRGTTTALVAEIGQTPEELLALVADSTSSAFYGGPGVLTGEEVAPLVAPLLGMAFSRAVGSIVRPGDPVIPPERMQ